MRLIDADVLVNTLEALIEDEQTDDAILALVEAIGAVKDQPTVNKEDFDRAGDEK